MKELLYIPSGKYFRFFPEDANNTDKYPLGEICWPIELMVGRVTASRTYEKIISTIVNYSKLNPDNDFIFNRALYKNAEIDFKTIDTLTEAEFELVEV